MCYHTFCTVQLSRKTTSRSGFIQNCLETVFDSAFTSPFLASSLMFTAYVWVAFTLTNFTSSPCHQFKSLSPIRLECFSILIYEPMTITFPIRTLTKPRVLVLLWLFVNCITLAPNGPHEDNRFPSTSSLSTFSSLFSSVVGLWNRSNGFNTN